MGQTVMFKGSVIKYLQCDKQKHHFGKVLNSRIVKTVNFGMQCDKIVAVWQTKKYVSSIKCGK